MKKIILILFVVAIASANSNAQEKKKHARTAEERTEKLIVSLNEKLVLSDEQKIKVKEILFKREKQRDELRKQFENNQDALREAGKKNIKGAEEELKTILSTEQMEKLKEFQEEMKKKNKARKAPEPTASVV